jgi:hypothetical protein
LSGVLTVALVSWLGSRILDRTTALIASLLMAVLPSMIGYSRLGWDSSQTALFSVLALYFAFRGKSLAMMISFALCLIAHVTNIFLFPVLLAPFLVALWNTEREPTRRRVILGMTVFLGLIAVSTIVVIDSKSNHFLLASRAAPGNGLRFLGHYGRLISGATLYEFVVGPLSPRTRDLYDGAFWVLFLAMLAFGVPRLAQNRQWDRLALIAGLGIAALGFYIVGGPDVIQPRSERYGMWLMAPTILVVASLVSAVFPRPDDSARGISRPLAFAVMAIAGWILLFSFKVHYFDAIRATGGESHLAFRTAAVEPKQRVLQLIVDDVSRRNPAVAQEEHNASSHGNPNIRVGHGAGSTQPVVVENWWLYWPLRFLSCRQPGIEVIRLEDDATFPGPANRITKIPLKTTLSSGGYAVAFAGGDFEKLVASSITADRLDRWDVLDYGGRKLITVFRVQSR